MRERIQKILSQQGIASRREAERWIGEGRITLNRETAQLGASVQIGDEVGVDGRFYRAESNLRPPKVYLYNKPEGELCSTADDGEHASVFANLPSPGTSRWVMVGRLDLNTQGLLLFTTDGGLAHHLMHPSHEMQRVYAVRVHGELPEDALKTLVAGVELEDGPALFERIDEAGGDGSNRWFHVVLREGRNREVRRLWETQGVRVSRLIRLKYGPISLPRMLRRGKGVWLEEADVRALCTEIGYRPEEKIVLRSRKPTKPRRRAGKR